jgi:hypothetical protein
MEANPDTWNLWGGHDLAYTTALSCHLTGNLFKVRERHIGLASRNNDAAMGILRVGWEQQMRQLFLSLLSGTSQKATHDISI